MEPFIGDKKASGIYKIINFINKKFYIGSASNLYKRYKEHKSSLLRGDHHNNQLQRFSNKYGIKNLKFVIIEYCNLNQLEYREQYYVDSNIKTIMNETLVVGAVNRGRKLSTKHKSNISKALKGKLKSEIHKQNMSIARMGVNTHCTEEWKEKIQISLKNINQIDRGKKISKALKGRKVTWTLIHNDETKRIIGENNKNNNLKPITQYDLEGNFIREWASIRDAAYFVSPTNPKSARSSISDCLRNKLKTSFKSKWKYKI